MPNLKESNVMVTVPENDMVPDLMNLEALCDTFSHFEHYLRE